jgi:tungstate transport system ATP-binding protein
MSMRAPATNLPVQFENVGIVAGGVTILDTVSLAFEAGAPTVLIGPNGSGKTTLLRCHGPDHAYARSHHLGRNDSTYRRAACHRVPASDDARRSVAANITYALANAGIYAPAGARIDDAQSSRRGRPRQSDRRTAFRREKQQRLALARALARDPGAFSRWAHRKSDPAATKAIEDVVCAVVARTSRW